jgi:hypothetical protein
MIQVAMQSLVLGATGIVGGLITQSLALQGEKPFALSRRRQTCSEGDLLHDAIGAYQHRANWPSATSMWRVRSCLPNMPVPTVENRKWARSVRSRRFVAVLGASSRSFASEGWSRRCGLRRRSPKPLPPWPSTTTRMILPTRNRKVRDNGKLKARC